MTPGPPAGTSSSPSRTTSGAGAPSVASSGAGSPTGRAGAPSSAGSASAAAGRVIASPGARRAQTSTEPAGSNCADGGLKIEVGLDDNNDGSLQANEVDQTQYVCNGGDGQDGQDGADGSASPNTMLTSISAPTLQACSSGGRIVQQGLDNGDGGGTAQNGVLESGEVDYTTTYCSNYKIGMVKEL